jgi:hypothetical protein
MKRLPVNGSARGQPEHVASGDEIINRRSWGVDQHNGQPIKRQREKPPPCPTRNHTAMKGESRIALTHGRRPCYASRSRRSRCPTFPK